MEGILMGMFDTELMGRITIPTIVENYSNAIRELREGIKNLKKAQDYMRLAINPKGRAGYQEEAFDIDLKNRIKHYRKHTWYYIVDSMNIKDIMTPKRYKELCEQIEKDKVPDITVKNINDFIDGTKMNLKEMLDEHVAEVFDYLMPHRWQNHKTNKKHMIGKKVIKEHAITTAFSVDVNYHYRSNLKCMENVFHILDKKLPPEYPNDICSVISQTADKGEWETETEYFHLKWYKKGTLHIEFKRDDLRQMLNQMASDYTALPEEAR
jgi:hypothetical protein